jgi:hypothetical protein
MRHFILIALLFSGSALAQNTVDGGLDKSMQSLASDLASLQREIHADRNLGIAGEGVASVQVKKNGARVYTAADKSSGEIKEFKAGATLPVVNKVDDWYVVNLLGEGDHKVGWVQADWVAPKDYNFTAKATSEEDIYQKVIGKIQDLKRKYDDNDYVRVSGFSVDVGIPPSVNISFEFKDSPKDKKVVP